MPPTAAATGTPARRGFRRLPATNSCFSSIPTMKKNTANSPSAAQWASDMRRCMKSGPTSVASSDW